MNKEIANRFKKLTGYNWGDIGRILGVSRQYVNQLWHNHSITYKTATAFAINLLIDRKIRELNRQTEDLEQLKREIIAEALEKAGE